MTKLVYRNDRKGKNQSHKIKNKEEFEDFLDGYGENLLEALEEHKKELKR